MLARSSRQTGRALTTQSHRWRPFGRAKPHGSQSEDQRCGDETLKTPFLRLFHQERSQGSRVGVHLQLVRGWSRVCDSEDEASIFSSVLSCSLKQLQGSRRSYLHVDGGGRV